MSRSRNERVRPRMRTDSTITGQEINPTLSPVADIADVRPTGHVDPTWWEPASFTVQVLARIGRPFTVADIRANGVLEPPLSQHWGLLIAAAVRSGVVAPVGAELADSGRPRRLWVGTLS